MIQRIVLVKLKADYATTVERNKIVEHSQNVLPTMRGVISAMAGFPADERARAWDLSITVVLETIADVSSLRECPIHQLYSRECLGPRMECHEAWNFDVSLQ